MLAYLIFGIGRYNAIPADTRNVLIQSTTFLIAILTTWAICSFSADKTTAYLGLDKPVLKTMLWALLCTSPMLVGGLILLGLNEGITAKGVLFTSVWAGVFEELFFRAFITGLLVRLAKWHIVPAILISSLLFGWGHLYQAENLSQALIIFLATSGAGIGFAVFYKLWNWNIWFPMFMHIFMNLSFAITNMGSTVLLNNTGNTLRIISIITAISLTIILMYKRLLPDFNTGNS